MTYKEWISNPINKEKVETGIKLKAQKKIDYNVDNWEISKGKLKKVPFPSEYFDRFCYKVYQENRHKSDRNTWHTLETYKCLGTHIDDFSTELTLSRCPVCKKDIIKKWVMFNPFEWVVCIRDFIKKQTPASFEEMDNL